MLELKDITKIYPAGGDDVHALKGISLKFRESEFVSILGQSGCGKTTMLNIIGGLDRYTTGDLIINGRSTKDFKARDWDGYRNHSVGFVFQSYNLIPHQTVLQNVELALTLSGVRKKERRRRAKEALELVGLGNQLRKKPSEMSGGQMQRVAIARAIVNDPEIILADEPTGALDTETSIQVMEILKKISKDRLVIMVTHNPELAERYSTRIIRMLDGLITSDSQPITAEEEKQEKLKDVERIEKAGKKKKPSMSLRTSFGLSLKNLFVKRGRTTLTSFAGSIGIIGIALIYAVSQGMTGYIDTVQEETLSSYPLTLESQTIDMSSLISTFMGKAESVQEHDNDGIYQKAMMYSMVKAMNSLDEQENDLKSFKTALEEELSKEDSTLSEAISGIQYTYDPDILIYTENVDGDIVHSDTQEMMMELMSGISGTDFSSLLSLSESSTLGSSYSDMVSSSTAVFQEMIPGEDGELINPLIEKQYDMIYGRWPQSYDEVVLVVDENNEINDLTLYALGLISEEYMTDLMSSAFDGEDVEYDDQSWSYEDICGKSFRTILNSDCYVYDETNGTYSDLRDTDAGLRYLYDNGLDLKVVGVIRPTEDSLSSVLTGTVCYTSALTEHMINEANDSDAVKAQEADPDTDIFTGLPFESTDSLDQSEKAAYFKNYAENADAAEQASIYTSIMSIPDETSIQQTVAQTMGTMTYDDMVASMTQAMSQQMSMSEEEIQSYIASMSEEDLTALFEQSIEEQFTSQYAEQVQEQLSAYSEEDLAAMLQQSLDTYTDEQCADYDDNVLEFSESTYEDNLIALGCADLDDPASINLYASSFENKDVIEDFISDYNDSVDEMEEIQYTDYVGLMMSSITTIINAITYVLIAFVAVSLIVSSIMIGVITLISVQERTKEIGILRAIGASKRNVSNMFNAETLIIGFTSGAMGVLITYLLCIPINLILHSLTGINNLSAYLPPQVAVVLVLISMFLTLISGIIPSRSAAKKDPVVALRSE